MDIWGIVSQAALESQAIMGTWLAQSVKHAAPVLRVLNSSPTLDVEIAERKRKKERKEKKDR